MAQLPLFEPPSWTVSDLTNYLRNLLESDAVLQDLWVMGEVSNLSRPSSGHLYFTLKDVSASLRCVMWRQTVITQNWLPHDGDAIEAHGYVSIYEVGGQYQLYIDRIRPAGEGLLYQQFLLLKAKLEAEGLFAAEDKRPIPRWPKRIGVVTSQTGAAIRDVLNTLQRRYPLAEVILAPAPVQGVEAPPAIITALQNLEKLTSPDVILLVRGGGSIEDLWAFNDEQVARAIASSATPIITGVGHETDFTIADFVADLRAPTPTAAAEMATPNRIELMASLAELKTKLERIAQYRVDELRMALESLANRLRLQSPKTRIRSDRQRLDGFFRRSLTSLYHQIQLHRAHLLGLDQHLVALSPQSILNRGYAIVTLNQGEVVRSVKQVSNGDPIGVQVSDGKFDAEVKAV